MAFRYDPKALQTGLNNFATRAIVAVRAYAETEARKLEDHAKKNRPWTDRTGAARERLNATVTQQPSKIRITLAHGVEYGLWLELARNKNYAIIQPTIDLKSPQIFNGLGRLFDRMH
jgi:hypothetical protein